MGRHVTATDNTSLSNSTNSTATTTTTTTGVQDYTRQYWFDSTSGIIVVVVIVHTIIVHTIVIRVVVEAKIVRAIIHYRHSFVEAKNLGTT